jgi:hypothetical protein
MKMCCVRMVVLRLWSGAGVVDERRRGRAAAWKINSKSALESGARTSTLFCSGNVNFETHK